MQNEPLDLEPIKARLDENYHRVRIAPRALDDIAALIAEVERLREVEHDYDLVKRGIVEIHVMPSLDDLRIPTPPRLRGEA